VFQVESAGMRKALADMKADRFEDIIALVALYRPGPMANIPVYNARKNGLANSETGEPESEWYLDPALEPILKETYGIIVYQEQVMQAAQLLAGYSLGDADLLRRAMGKKIKSEMDAQRSIFIKGALERGMQQNVADEIFDLLAKFADYGFNKSHAAAYALISYQTAYLKANYPVEFMAASMTLDMDNTDKLAEFRREAQRLGIKVEPPDINRSGTTFLVENGVIFYALAAIRGVGVQAVDALIAARAEGPFKHMGDLARRLPHRAVNKRTLEALAASGAFDGLEKDRARAFASIEPMMTMAQQAAEAAQGGMGDMFGGVADASVELRLPPYSTWTVDERLKREYEAVGFFLSGHPLDDYEMMLNRMKLMHWSDFGRSVKNGASTTKIAASVLGRTERRTKSGSKMGILSLSDPTGHFEAIVFSETLASLRDVLEPGKHVLLTLQGNLEGDEVRARILHAEPLDAVITKLGKGLRITLNHEKALSGVRQHLKEKGDADIAVLIKLDAVREVEIKLPGRYAISPQMAGTIRTLQGVEQVDMI
jgi:DNA polymerase III subunit alpha